MFLLVNKQIIIVYLFAAIISSLLFKIHAAYQIALFWGYIFYEISQNDFLGNISYTFFIMPIIAFVLGIILKNTDDGSECD